MSLSATTQREPPLVLDRRSLIAGWSSLLVHLTVLLGGVLLLRTSPQPEMPETPRRVAIVVAAQSESSTQYFDESATGEAEEEQSSESPASTAEASASAGLPGGEAVAALSPQIALPGAIAQVVDGVALGTASTSGGNRGRAILDPYAGRADILAAEAKRPRGGGPTGPPGTVQLFGNEGAQGHSFVFVIDRSQSMGRDGLNAIAAAEVELLRELENLKSNHSFQIVAYNQTPLFFQGRKLLPVSDKSRQSCSHFLRNLAAYGATNHDYAIRAALELKPDVLYLLTDGDPVLTAGQRRLIREATRGHTTISCVQFGRVRPPDESTREALQALASDNGGSYIFIDMNKR